MVVDLAGFSAACDAASDIESVIRTVELKHRRHAELIGRHGGMIVKAEADNLFALFGTIEQAIEAACHIVRLVPIGDPFVPCCGIAAGEILTSPGDNLWGSPVNRASKLGEDTAARGEIVIDAAAMTESLAQAYGGEAILYRVAGVDRQARRLKILHG